ncbi:MAG TPA: hypothetical protein VI758_04070 [Bacteroidota bacterium]
MDRSQQYVASLLEKLPKWELSDPQHQNSFDRIKDSLLNASDLQSRLKALYKVSGFSDVALGLMWIAERVESDPSKLESTAEEENLVLGLLKNAFGESSPAGFANPVMDEQPTTSLDEPSPAGDGFSQPDTESGFSPPGTSPAASPDSTPGEAAPISSGGGGEVSEQEFSATLERLVEAVQSGSEERTALLEQLSGQAEGIVGSQASDNDYKTFCGYLIEFLKYVSMHQLFDDIRVMNLLSNIYDPFSQWAKADASSRPGMLEQAIEILRDFKALFE